MALRGLLQLTLIVMRQTYVMQIRAHRLVALIAFWGASVIAGADEPPSWTEFSVCSESGRFCAEVTATDGEVEAPWNRTYKLTVMRNTENDKHAVWSVPYDYDGYPGGLIAEDGRTFVYVSFWFYPNDAVVRIYRQGSRFALAGTAFGIPPSQLVDTVSHQMWLSDRQPAHGLVGDETLRIRTIDGASHSIRLADGVLVK